MTLFVLFELGGGSFALVNMQAVAIIWPFLVVLKVVCSKVCSPVQPVIAKMWSH